MVFTRAAREFLLPSDLLLNRQHCAPAPARADLHKNWGHQASLRGGLMEINRAAVARALAIYEIASRGLRQDTAGRLRLCGGHGELAAKEFQEPARARPAVGAVPPHAQEEHKQVAELG